MLLMIPCLNLWCWTVLLLLGPTTAWTTTVATTTGRTSTKNSALLLHSLPSSTTRRRAHRHRLPLYLSCQDYNDRTSSRRAFFLQSTRGIFTTIQLTTFLSSTAAQATTVTTTTTTAKEDLLQAIQTKQSDDVVLDIINRLPRTATNATINGQWELIWSYKTENFSPLLQLPYPFRPTSYQYIGTAVVPSGRIAQGLTGGIIFGRNELLLSANFQAASSDPTILEIFPPFRLEISGPRGEKDSPNQKNLLLIESNSDAEFRQINGRTVQAQQAGRNLYQQWYIDEQIRVSSVIAGDPVIVGEVFVHRRCV